MGPFLSKNFASTISPWIVTLDALEPFRTKGYIQDPKVFPYLEYKGNKNVDIKLEVAIQPENSTETVICNSNYNFDFLNLSRQYYPNLALLKLYFETDLLFWQLVSVFTAFS